jgi:2-oxoglutarate dehydrogenase E1 component
MRLFRPFAKPLVVMTGKWLQFHSACISDLADMGPGTFFRRVIIEGQQGDNMLERTKSKLTLVKPPEIRKVIFCTGQVVYCLI